MSTSNKIVAAALLVFENNGFHAAGVDLLSEAAGVTKRTLYKHFPSKELLIDAALELRHQRFLASLRDHVTTVAVSDRPVSYIAFIAGLAARSEFRGCTGINAAAEYPLLQQNPHKLADQHKAEVRALLLALCVEGGAKDSGAVADALFLIGEGLIVVTQVQGYNESVVKSAVNAASKLWCAARVEEDGGA